MKNMKSVLLGVVVGILLSVSADYLLGVSTHASLWNGPYFRLQSDCVIGEAGYLKKGTVLKHFRGMDEGFDCYVLFLNMKGGDIANDEFIQASTIVPYWLDPTEVK